jgi:hypothetical protein
MGKRLCVQLLAVRCIYGCQHYCEAHLLCRTYPRFRGSCPLTKNICGCPLSGQVHEEFEDCSQGSAALAATEPKFPTNSDNNPTIIPGMAQGRRQAPMTPPRLSGCRRVGQEGRYRAPTADKGWCCLIALTRQFAPRYPATSRTLLDRSPEHDYRASPTHRWDCSCPRLCRQWAIFRGVPQGESVSAEAALHARRLRHGGLFKIVAFLLCPLARYTRAQCANLRKLPVTMIDVASGGAAAHRPFRGCRRRCHMRNEVHFWVSRQRGRRRRIMQAPRNAHRLLSRLTRHLLL